MAKANPDPKAPAPQVNDVTEADKALPSDSAKPIIVTNRPLIKDPMVTAKSADKVLTKQGDGDHLPARTRGVRIEPLSAPELPEATAAKASKPAAEAAKPDTKPELSIEEAIKAASSKQNPAKPAKPEPEAKAKEKPEPEAKPETKPKKKPAEPPGQSPVDRGAGGATEDPQKAPSSENTAKPEEKPAPAETPSGDESAADKAKTDQPVQKDEAAQVAENQRQKQVNQLVTSRQFFLPINSVEKRRTRRFVVLGVFLSLLLALAWVDIALDAGLISLNGIQPLTHFFST